MLPILLSIFKPTTKKQTGTNTNPVVLLIVILIIVIALIIATKAVMKKIRQNRFDNQAGSEIGQWIIRLRSTHNWYNDNENEVFEVMKEIGTVEKFQEVSKLYRKTYGEYLQDYLSSFLDTEEIKKAFSYLKSE